jgi:flavodoxin I
MTIIYVTTSSGTTRKKLFYTVRQKGEYMKTLIVYASKTGNTGKLTGDITGWIKGEHTYAPVDEAPEPAGFDNIIVALWLAGGKPEPRSAEYLGRIGKGRLFLVATHGAAAGSEHVKNALDFAANLAGTSELAGSFSCQGQVDPAVLAAARQKSPQPVWIRDADAAVGHPDGRDIENLKQALQKGLPELFG